MKLSPQTRTKLFRASSSLPKILLDCGYSQACLVQVSSEFLEAQKLASRQQAFWSQFWLLVMCCHNMVSEITYLRSNQEFLLVMNTELICAF